MRQIDLIVAKMVFDCGFFEVLKKRDPEPGLEDVYIVNKGIIELTISMVPTCSNNKQEGVAIFSNGNTRLLPQLKIIPATIYRATSYSCHNRCGTEKLQN